MLQPQTNVRLRQPDAVHPPRGSTGALFGALALLIAVGVAPRPLRGDVAIGKIAPDFELQDIDGKTRSLAAESGHPVVIVFGELYNKNTLAAMDELARVVAAKPLQDVSLTRWLLLGTRDPTDAVKRDWARLQRKDGFVVFHDVQRRTFEAYNVKVLPTIAILDGERKLVLSMSGFPLNFSDIVTDAVLYATGRVSRERLDRVVTSGATSEMDQTRLKAIRTSRMGLALARRKLYEMAIQRFEEALALDSSLIDARLGLASVRFEQSRVQQSEKLYKQVLEQAPGTVRAHIGLARIEIKRDQIEQASARLKTQIALHPQQPELHFLLGSAHERADRKDKALSAYKRAAQLLLERYR